MKKSRKLIVFVVCMLLAMTMTAMVFTSSAVVNNIVSADSATGVATTVTMKHSQPIKVNGVNSGAILTQMQITGGLTSGSNTALVSAVEVPAGYSGMTLEVMNNGSYVWSKATVGSAALTYNSTHSGETVVAGVNADPWIMYHTDYDGDGVSSTGSAVKHVSVSRGLMVIDGEIWATPQCDDENNLARTDNAERGTAAAKQPAFMILNDNTYVIGAPQVAPFVVNQATSTQIIAAGINRLPAPNSLMFYTNRTGASSAAYTDAYEVYVELNAGSELGFYNQVYGTVTGVYASGTGDRPAIGENTVVMSARGSAIASLQAQFPAGTSGQSVYFDVHVTFDHTGHNANTAASLKATYGSIKDAVSGFYELTKNGEYMGQSVSTNYPCPFVGIREDGTAVFVTVTATYDGTRVSTQMRDLPRIAKDLGLVNSIMFDGGGSATMITLEGSNYVRRASAADGSGAVRSVINSLFAVYHGADLSVTNQETGSITILSSTEEATLPTSGSTPPTSSGTTTTDSYQNVSAIDSINGVSDGSFALPGSPVTTVMKGTLDSSYQMTVSGWSIVNGGVNGGIHYSVNGGDWQATTPGTNAYSTAGTDVMNAVAANAPNFVSTSATNGRFNVIVPLDAYVGQEVTVRLSTASAGGTFSQFATITNVAVGTSSSGSTGSTTTGSSNTYIMWSNINGTDVTAAHSYTYLNGATVAIQSIANPVTMTTTNFTITGWAIVTGGQQENGIVFRVNDGDWQSTAGTYTATAQGIDEWITLNGATFGFANSDGTFTTNSNYANFTNVTANLASYAGQTVSVTFGIIPSGSSSATPMVTFTGVTVPGSSSGGSTGDSETHTHSYTTYTTAGNATHTIACSCGDTITESCTTSDSWSFDSSTHYKTCTLCNGKVDTGFHSGNIPTCTSKATCSTCNVEFGEYGNHIFEYREGTVPDCDTAGVAASQYCTTCNTLYDLDGVTILVEARPIAATGHNWTQESRIEPTCTQSGFTAGTYCSECGYIESGREVLPATGVHTYENGQCTMCGIISSEDCTHVYTSDCDTDCDNGCGYVRVAPHASLVAAGDEIAPTCGLDGQSASMKCSACGLVVQESEFMPATGEHNLYTSPAYSATCITPGYTEQSICLTCGLVIVEQMETAPLGHTEVSIPGIAPTCLSSGVASVTYCTVCNEITVAQEDLSQTAHTEEIILGTPATCFQTGLTDGKRCTVCGTITVEQQVIEKTDHREVVTPGREPTCTQVGLVSGKVCGDCGVVIVEQIEIDKLAHEYSTYIYNNDGNCTSTGTETSTCDYGCGAEDTRNVSGTPAGHQWVNADCTTPKTCSVCQETEGEALGHAWTNACDTTCNNAGCTETRVTEHVDTTPLDNQCDICGADLTCEHSVLTTLPAVASTCTKTGLTEGKQCQTCGNITVEQQIVPVAAHTPKTIPAVAPDCTNTGLTEGSVCSVCNATLTEQQVVEATGHTIVTTDAVAPQVGVEGKTYGMSCSVCGEILVAVETIPALEKETHDNHHDVVTNTTPIAPPTVENAQPDNQNPEYVPDIKVYDREQVKSITNDTVRINFMKAENEILKAPAIVDIVDGLDEINTELLKEHKTLSISQIFEISDEAEGSEDYNGGYTFTLTNVADIEKVVAFLHYENGAWTKVPDEDVVIDISAGTITVTLDSLSPGAIGVEEDCPHINYIENPSEAALKTAANCQNSAVYYKSCELCGALSTETFEYGDKDATAHASTETKYVVSTTAPTTMHNQVYACCGASTGAAEAEHTWENGTCKACEYACQHTDGNSDFVCDICQVTIHTHTYEDVVTAPTCVAQGYTTHTCTTCGDSYKDTYTSATGVHTFLNDADSTCESCDYVRETAASKLVVWSIDNVNGYTIGGVYTTGKVTTVDWSKTGLSGTQSLAITGWAIAEGGQNGIGFDINHSGTITPISTGVSTAENAVLGAAQSQGITTASGENGRFYSAPVALGTYAGQTLTITIYSQSSVDVPILEIVNYQVPTNFKAHIDYLGVASATAFGQSTTSDGSTIIYDMGGTSTNKLYLTGWVMIQGGQTDTLYYSVNGGTSWNSVGDTLAITDGNNAHIASAADQLTGGDTTGWKPANAVMGGNAQGYIDLAGYAGHSVDLVLSRISTNGERVIFLQVNNINVPGNSSHTCTEGLYSSNGNGSTHKVLCNQCGITMSESVACTPGGNYIITETTHGQNCTVCGTLVSTSNGNHVSSVIPGTDATCSSTGLTAGSECSVCKYVIKAQETIEMLAHTPGEAATCTSAQTCTECGEELAPMIAHKDNDGDQFCDDCGEDLHCAHENTTELPAVDVTCTTDGKTAGVHCNDCGVDITPQETIPQTGHAWDNACDTDCNNNCGYTRTIEHNYVDGVCSVCGKVYAAHPYSGYLDLVQGSALAEEIKKATPDNYIIHTLTSPLGSDRTLTLNGWIVMEGGHQGFYYSVDGGSTWIMFSAGTAGSEAHAGVAAGDGITDPGSISNVCFNPASINLSAYKGQTKTVILGAKAENGDYVAFAEICNVVVPGDADFYAAIETINGYDSDEFGLPFLTTDAPGVIDWTGKIGADMLAIQGWATAIGGQNGISYSVNGGTLTSIGGTYTDLRDDITAALADAGFNVTHTPNGCWNVTDIDLTSWRTQTITIDFYINPASDTTVPTKFLTINNYKVSGAPYAALIDTIDGVGGFGHTTGSNNSGYLVHVHGTALQSTSVSITGWMMIDGGQQHLAYSLDGGNTWGDFTSHVLSTGDANHTNTAMIVAGDANWDYSNAVFNVGINLAAYQGREVTITLARVSANGDAIIFAKIRVIVPGTSDHACSASTWTSNGVSNTHSALCSTCGIEILNMCVASDTYTSDANSHWKTCIGCLGTITGTYDAHNIDTSKTCEEGRTCTECGYVVIAPSACTPNIPAATCTTAQVCTVCNNTMAEKVPHAEVEHEAQEATCQQEGWEAYKTCENCDWSTQVIIPMTDHIAPEVYDCTVGMFCKICNTQMADAAADHTAGPEATCANAQYCTVCQTVLKAKLDHSPNIEEPTCTEDKVCTLCGELIAENLGGHDKLKEVIIRDATCILEGIKEIRCSKCDTLHEQVTIEKVAHTPGEEATCTSAQICTFEGCGYVIKEALGHELAATEDVVDATCTTDGYTTYACSRCNYTEKGDLVPATGHTLTQYPQKDATCGAEGYNAYEECSVCDYTTWTDDKIIPATGLHTYDNNCGDAECNVCGEARTTFPGTHTGGVATCTKQAICANCEQAYGELDKVNGHTWVDATCTAPKTCSECKEETGEKLEHTYDTTCDVDCNICGTEREVTHTWNKEYSISLEGHWIECSICFVKQAEVAAHGWDNCDSVCEICEFENPDEHTAENGTEATCTAQAVCGLCGESFGELAAHTPDIEAPTCTQAQKCSVCQEELQGMAPHTYGTPIEGKDATCTEAGWESYSKCDNCDATTEIVPIPAINHENKTEVPAVAPTCTADGTKAAWQCDDCGKYFKEDGESFVEIDEPEVDPSTGHNKGEWEIITAPTCTEAGEKVKKCTVCGEIVEKSVVDATGHDIEGVEFVTEKDATCTEAGEKVKRCTECNAVVETEAIDALGHTDNWITLTPATCTDAGERVNICKICNAEIEREAIEALGHTWDSGVKTDATCTTDGYTLYTCSVCFEEEKREIVTATGHTEKTIPEVPATCQQAGTSEYKVCETCGTILTAPTEIPASQHVWGEWSIITDATCYSTGERAHTCNLCSTTEEEVIELKAHDMQYTSDDRQHWKACANEGCAYAETTREGHTFEGGTCTVCQHVCVNHIVKEGSEATCTEKATCEICGEKFGEALGHTYMPVSGTPATCTQSGLTDGSQCSVCQAWETEQETIEATGHSWSEDAWSVTVAPKCTTTGTATRECDKGCGETETKTLDAIGHAWDDEGWVITTQPTCEDEGEQERYCTNGCGEKQTEVIKANDHTEATDWTIKTPAQCEIDGEKVILCTVCQKELQSEVITHTGHAWDDEGWSETTAPTCTSLGQATRFCTNGCGKSETKDIAMLEHTESNWIVESDATCEVNGLRYTECTGCGERLSEETTNATGHDYGEGSITQSPTCTASGILTKTCVNCGDVILETITATGHTEEKVLGKDATCTETGLTDGVKCSVCGAVITEQEEIPMKEHTSEEIPAVDATCTATGLTAGAKCSECGEILTAQTEVPMKAHTFTTIDGKDATCTETGLVEVKVCDVCDKMFQVIADEDVEILDKIQPTISALGHSHAAGTPVPPTCTEGGYTVYTCIRCSDSYTADEIDALGHEFDDNLDTTCNREGCDYTRQPDCDHVYTYECDTKCSICETEREASHNKVNLDGKEPTCTDTGLEAATQCTYCSKIFNLNGEVIEAQVVIPELGHQTTTTPAQEATCTEIGWNEYVTCSRCDYTTYEEISATGHINVSIIDAIEPTCTTTGLTEGKQCACGTWIIEQSVIPALGHTREDLYAKAPTCTETGLTAGSYCSVCNETIVKQETVDATGHTVVDVVIAPTCTTGGYTVHRCSVCGEMTAENSDLTEATGHTSTFWVTTKPATCTTAGSEKEICRTCGKDTGEVRELTMEHEYTVSVVISATCTTDGYTIEICKNCGDEQRTNEVESNGHKTEWVITTPATCTTSGEKYEICTVCDTKLQQGVTVEPTDHNLITTTIVATCTSGGYSIDRCSECAHESAKYNETQPTGHSTETTDRITAATCEADGKTEKLCKTCGAVVSTETIKSTGHKYISVTTEPTCTTDGYITVTCANCTFRNIETSEELKALGHESEGWITDKLPNCTEEGSKRSVCKRCGEVLETEAIAKTEHNMVTVIVPATCAASGSKTTSCSLCGGEETVETIPTLGHTIVVEDAQRPTDAVQGLTSGAYCSECNTRFIEGTSTFTSSAILGDHLDIVDLATLEGNIPALLEVLTQNGYAHSVGIFTWSNVSGLGNDDFLKLINARNDILKVPEIIDIAAGLEDIKLEVGQKLSFSQIFDINDTSADADSYTGTYTITLTPATQDEFAALLHYVNGAWVVVEATVDASGNITATVDSLSPFAIINIVECDHAGAELEYKFQPTCTEAGYTSYVCYICGNERTVEGEAATGHKASGWSVVTDATCTTEGTRNNVCLVCDYVIDTQTIEALGHSYTASITSFATCTESGVITYVCTVCPDGTEGHLDYTEYDATGHVSAGWIVTEKATCTANGTESKLCAICGDTLDTREVVSQGHTNEVTIPAVAPTCTAAGKTEGKFCMTCGKVTVQPTATEELGHTESDWIITDAATCTADGTRVKKCTVCDTELAREVITSTGHTEQINPAVEATCQKPGLTQGTICTKCGQIMVEQQIISATNHNGTITTLPAIAPTCTTAGRTEGAYCTACGVVTAPQSTVSATGHAFTDNSNGTRTCDTCGYVEVLDQCSHEYADACLSTECNLCGQTRTAPGHVEIIVPGKTATCEAEGLTEGTKCAVCNKELTAQTATELAPCIGSGATCTSNDICLVCGTFLAAQTGHVNKDYRVVVDATCANGGLKAEYCIDCGVYTGNTVAITATGAHAYGEAITTEATCSTSGSVYRVCGDCGAKEILETTAATNAHTGGNANCTSRAICEVCKTPYGEIDASKHVTAAGDKATCSDALYCILCTAVVEPETGVHSFTAETISNATCDAQGQIKNTCECGYVEIQTIAKTEHTPNIESATCTDAKVCQVCQAVLEVALGHTGGNATCMTPAECDTCGIAYGTVNADAHIYTNDCDAYCDECYAKRESTLHGTSTTVIEGYDATCTSTGLKDGAKCALCGEIITEQEEIPATGHTFIDNVCACGATRCVNHVYDNDCDTTCNNDGCTYTREATEHYYLSNCDTTCNACGAERTLGEGVTHTYSNSCDTSCNECGTERVVVDGHKYSADCDAICNNCGYERSEVADHEITSATCKDASICANCGAVVSAASGNHTYEGCNKFCSICGDGERTVEHTTQKKYSASFHYDECTMCGLISNIAEHTYADRCGELTCEECDNTITVAHIFTNACSTECISCGNENARPAEEITHKFDNACDAICNICGLEREVGEHKYSGYCDNECDICGARRNAEHKYTSLCDRICDLCGDIRNPVAGHMYSNKCDAYCNICNFERNVQTHKYGVIDEETGKLVEVWMTDETTGTHWLECYICGNRKNYETHSYSDPCTDTECICGYVREELGAHVYTDNCDTTCNACGFTRSVKHVYSNNCDRTCNTCQFIREESELTHVYAPACSQNCIFCEHVEENNAHKYANGCDTTCDYGCGFVREPNPHEYAYDCSTTCSICGSTREVDASKHVYEFECSPVCSNCGSARTEGGKGHKLQWQYDDESHWRICTICSFIDDGTLEGHRFRYIDNGDGTHDIKCLYNCGIHVQGVEHEYAPATCDKAEECACGAEKEGSVSLGGHIWVDATCTTAKTCSRCGKTSGRPLGHSFTDATCTEGEICTVCNAAGEPAYGHEFIDGVCELCGAQETAPVADLPKENEVA